MAQCKDCIHYEICDEYVSPCESFPEVDGCKCFTNKADVVPKSEYEQLKHKYELAVAERETNVKGFTEELAKAKSEVEQLKRNLEQCENGYRQQIHLLQCKLTDEKSKVREIFDEMEKNTKFTINLVEAMEWDSEEIRIAKLQCYRDCLGYNAKLKKKYTESEDKP